MIKKILCPVDYSVNAAKAVDFAVSIAHKTGAQLVLIHAFSGSLGTADYTDRGPHSVRDNELIKLQTWADKIHSLPGEEQLLIECVAMQGRPDTSIVNFADEHAIDLIVMGTQGATHLDEMLFGTVTSHVIKKSDLPVLAIPSSAEFISLQSILVALELDTEGDKFLDQVVAFARAFQAEIRVLHIITEGEEVQAGPLQKLIKQRYQYPNLKFFSLFDEDVVDGIEQFLSGHPSDILAMQTRRRSFWESLFSPSQTLGVAKFGDIPLLAFQK